MLTEFDMGWLVGIIEGEGSIWTSPRTAQVAVSMTDRDTVERLQSLWPSPTGIREVPPRNPRHKTQWEWSLARHADVKEFLRVIYPLLQSRRRVQADRALVWLRDRPYRRPAPRKTHCPQGHSYDGNCYVHPNGGRVCKTCRVESNRRYRKPLAVVA